MIHTESRLRNSIATGGAGPEPSVMDQASRPTAKAVSNSHPVFLPRRGPRGRPRPSQLRFMRSQKTRSPNYARLNSSKGGKGPAVRQAREGLLPNQRQEGLQLSVPENDRLSTGKVTRFPPEGRRVRAVSSPGPPHPHVTQTRPPKIGELSGFLWDCMCTLPESTRSFTSSPEANGASGFS